MRMWFLVMRGWNRIKGQNGPFDFIGFYPVNPKILQILILTIKIFEQDYTELTLTSLIGI